jgi:hypothetical protein
MIGFDVVDDAIGALDALTLAGELLSKDPRTMPVGRWIEAYLAGQAGDLFAFIADVENRPGHSFRRELQVRRRDVILRQAAMLYPGPVTERARLLSAELDRYYSSSWLPRDQVKPSCPYPADTVRALFWLALKAHARPIGAAHMRRVLAAHEP